jgi:integrase
MPSFRSPEKQAAKAVTRVLSLISRHDTPKDGKIHSIGTARAYQQALTQVAHWLREQGVREGLDSLQPAQAQAYLQERAEAVGQKTLPNIDKLARVHSELDRPALANQGRAYTAEQVRMVAEAQTARNALATEIAHAAGLRAHELYNLRPADERPPSAHRDWSATRFSGREGILYTVEGKGGLVREVLIPRDLAKRLEARRLEAPQRITDRGVHYTSHYDLGAGKAWSQSFTAASKRALGWSTGAHGLRHSYVQERMNELQERGMTYRAALGTVSQELGHFREDITEVYLR